MTSKSNTFLILGSGSTAGSFKVEINGGKFDPPKDKNFFKSDVVSKLYSQEKFPALHFFQDIRLSKSPKEDKAKYSLEKTWSDIDLALKLTNNNNAMKLRVISMAHDYKNLRGLFQKKAENNEDFKNNLNSQLYWVDEGGSIAPLASWEAVELVLKVFSNLKNEKDSAFCKIIRYIVVNSNLKGIATFNYDSSVESVWPSLNVEEKLYYYDPIQSSGYLNGIPLYKLHGSINWRSIFSSSREPKWQYIIPERIDSEPIFQKFNPRAYEIEEPAIIPPDSFKQNITLDIQNDPKSILFKKIWNRVWEELKEVEILIFIGFSFPDTDLHARILFSSAYRRNPFSRVIVNTLSDESLQRYNSIFDENIVNLIKEGTENMSNEIDKIFNK